MADYAIRADALGFDSVWASDHYFLDDRRNAGPDPLTLLAYLAGRTTRVELGTLVACSAFRAAGQLVREAKALSELSNGRFILGLGAGWFEPEFAAFDLPFDHRISRFSEYLDTVLLLLGGGAVEYGGHYVKLHGGQVHGGSTPPIWIGGAGPRLLQMTAEHADGWNAGNGDSRFLELLQVLREQESRVGRVPGSIIASRRAKVLLLDPGEERRLLTEHPDVDATVVIGDRQAILSATTGFREGGCDHLILHFSGDVWSNYRFDQLELTATILDDMRGR